MPTTLLRCVLAALALRASGFATAAPDDPAAPGYALRAGDHLVYRQWIDREVGRPRSQLATHAEWTTHVLVMAERGGSSQVGIQRNRQRLRLVRYVEGGKDRTEAERAALEERLAGGPAAFAEANWILPSGVAQLPWSIVRETSSEALFDMHEVEPLPATLAAGSAWKRSGGLDLAMQVSGHEPGSPGDCLRIEGTSRDPALRLRVWFCPASGSLTRLEFDAAYSAPPDRKVHETLGLELAERRRGEDWGAWLAAPDLRQGALAALLVSELPAISAERLSALSEAPDPAVQRQALALAYRRRLRFPAERLMALGASPSPRVRALAARLLEDRPLEPPAGDVVVARLARAVRGGGPLPDSACVLDAGWAERALRTQRVAGQVPGTTLRRVASGPFAGRPYIVRVPEEYRGDEPFPLLVYLSGGPGLALSGALEASDTVEPTEYLALYPQAAGPWWEPASAAATAAVLDDVLASFDVDTNRMFLAGFSNGGTGAFLYATLWPHRWAAVAPLMGGGLPFFGPRPPGVASLSRLPMLFLHGDADSVIPARATRDTVRALKREAADAPVEMEILEGRGHDVRFGNDGARVLAFLERHVRDPFPRRVVFETRDVATPRSFWVEVVAKKSGLARIEAEIDDTQTIRLTTRRVTRLRLLLRRELLARPGAPVRVLLNGHEAFSGPVVEDCGRLLASWRATGDPFLAHSSEIVLDVD